MSQSALSEFHIRCWMSSKTGLWASLIGCLRASWYLIMWRVGTSLCVLPALFLGSTDIHSSKGVYYALDASQHETVQFTHSWADTCLQHTVETCLQHTVELYAKAGEWLFIGHYVAGALGSMAATVLLCYCATVLLYEPWWHVATVSGMILLLCCAACCCSRGQPAFTYLQPTLEMVATDHIDWCNSL